MLKKSKADKVYFISQRHWHEQRLQHIGETENQREADDEVEEEKDEEEEEDDEESNDIVLAIIGHEEEYAEMSGKSSRSGRSLNKRFDSDYFYF